jgi:hypothetical protein
MCDDLPAVMLLMAWPSSCVSLTPCIRLQVARQHAFALNKRVVSDAKVHLHLEAVPKLQAGLALDIPAVPAQAVQPVLVEVGETPPSCPDTFGDLHTMTVAQLQRLAIEYNEPGLWSLQQEGLAARRARVASFLRGWPPGFVAL